MLKGTTLSRWQLKSVQDLLKVEGLRLVLNIQKPDSNTGSNAGYPLLFRSYCRLFVRPSALKHVDTAGLFSDTPRLICKASNQGIEEGDIEEIRKHDLDLILKFDSGSVGNNLLSATQYGVWSYHYGDPETSSPRPACFWEIYHHDAVTAAALVRISDTPASEVILRKGFFRTQSSYSRNIQLVCSEISRWPSQVCRDILNDDAGYITSSPRVPKRRTSAPPSTLQTVRFLSKILANRLRGVYRLLFRYSFWNIGVVDAPIQRFLDPGFKPKIEWLPRPPSGEFKADPFGMLESPNIHVFFENLDYHAPKGIIYTLQVRQGAIASDSKKIIELPVHMSYPYLVEHRGELYCVPETNRAREISVYKSTRFPEEWQRVGTLLSGVMAIDTTIFQHDEMWWMMFTDREKGGDANLYVWYAPDFWGPWKPHMNNPVKSDVRSARPGGTPFYHERALYRPAQDCSKTGGGKTVINRIKRLSSTSFDEEAVAVVEPDPTGPYPEGLHTISKVGDFTLVDGKRFEFSAFALFNNIVKGVRRTVDRE
jgi:hypothetical protein